MRELATAANFYAEDHKEQLWGNDPRNGWARRTVDGVIVAGPVYEYLGKAGEMLACPKNNRESGAGDRREIEAGPQVAGAELDSDYTLAVGAQGAKTSVESKIWYLDRASGRWRSESESPPRFMRAAGLAVMTRFRALPVFIEESTPWYNSVDTDGRWANNDQFTTRHQGDGFYTMLDVTVEKFDVSSGDSETVQEVAVDTRHRDWYVDERGNLSTWNRVYERVRGYGAINGGKFAAYP